VFVVDVHDKHSRRKAVELFDTTKVLGHFGVFAAKHQTFFLGDAGQRGIGQHALDVLHFLHRFADGGMKLVIIPPNQRSVTKGIPTLSAAFCTISRACFLVATNMIFCRFWPWLSWQLRRTLQHVGRAVEVNDVDTLVLHKDVRSHLRVPFFAQVAEVAAGVEEFLICRLLHEKVLSVEIVYLGIYERLI
jgi:hypothetical protein